jgi:large conductance mechanosensitive channel
MGWYTPGMKGFLNEFKKFALRGNMLDLAIGVVIGTAFNNIVNSLVTNILTPPLGLLTGNINFKDLTLNLGGTVRIEYGLFIQSVVTFLITALALFVLVRFMNRLAARTETDDQPKESKSAELQVLEEIRDSLKPKLADSSVPHA